jgi:hypothetical protein
LEVAGLVVLTMEAALEVSQLMEVVKVVGHLLLLLYRQCPEMMLLPTRVAEAVVPQVKVMALVERVVQELLSFVTP